MNIFFLGVRFVSNVSGELVDDVCLDFFVFISSLLLVVVSIAGANEIPVLPPVLLLLSSDFLFIIETSAKSGSIFTSSSSYSSLKM